MFDTARFLRDTFISPASLRAFLSAYGVNPPSAEVVQKWFYRGSIPGQWWPVLLAYKELDRGPVRLASYTKRDPAHEAG